MGICGASGCVECLPGAPDTPRSTGVTDARHRVELFCGVGMDTQVLAAAQ